MNYTNVLIVEDEAVIAADVRLMVEDMGFTALGIASSGEEGLRKAEALRPDLVLMDIKIKGDMDGVIAAGEIFRRFRIPVVYMTAYSDPRRSSVSTGRALWAALLSPWSQASSKISSAVPPKAFSCDRRVDRSGLQASIILLPRSEQPSR